MTEAQRLLMLRRYQIADQLNVRSQNFFELSQHFPDEVRCLGEDPAGEISWLIRICSQLIDEGLTLGLFSGFEYECLRRAQVENGMLPEDKRRELFRVEMECGGEDCPWKVCESLADRAFEDWRSLAEVAGISREEHEALEHEALEHEALEREALEREALERETDYPSAADQTTRLLPNGDPPVGKVCGTSPLDRDTNAVPSKSDEPAQGNPNTDNAHMLQHDMKHSPDFCTVKWGDREFTFSLRQAACVSVMWDAFEQGTPFQDQAYILGSACDAFEDISPACSRHVESLETAGRLRDVFKTRSNTVHDAWGTMIVREGKSRFGLQRPPAESPRIPT